MLQTDAEKILQHLEVIKNELAKHEEIRRQTREFLNSKEYLELKAAIKRQKNGL